MVSLGVRETFYLGERVRIELKPSAPKIVPKYGLVVTPKRLIECQAIYEGNDVGSRAQRNSNICNMKEPYTWNVEDYAKVTGRDKDGFLIFASVEEGKKACAQIPVQYSERFPDMTVVKYVNVFANTSPATERANYAAYVADCIGADLDSKLSEIL